jgi:hypothetical protein
LPLTSAQKTIAESEARFRVGVCGRRFGKSHIAMRELARFARLPNRLCLYIAPTYRQAKQVIFDPLKKRLQDINWLQSVNESELRLRLTNNSQILLRSAEAGENIRGLGADFAVLDECQDIDGKFFFEVVRPLLADRKGHALLLGTPKGKANFLYDVYSQAQHTEGWGRWQYRTIDGGIVSEDEIASAREQMDERSFSQEFLADFITTGTKIFHQFDRDRSVRKFDKDIPRVIFCGQDFNFTPATCVFADRTQQGIHIFDELKMDTSNTQEMADEMKRRYPNSRIISYADPSGRQNKSSAVGKTDFTILENAGIEVRAPRTHTAVKDTINTVNSLLLNADGIQKLFVDPRCKNLIESMDRWSYKESTHVPDKNSGWDHFSDCVRYLCDGLEPLRKNILPQTPARWGHKLGA